VSDFRDLARDPKHRRQFEKLLYLAAKHGEADLVAERLSWGIDPNCATAKGTTPLIANARSYCPSAATIRVLLQNGADPNQVDHAGLTALDYARRKLSRIQARPRRVRRKSSSLDENNQLQLDPAEQAELDRLREKMGDGYQEWLRIYWKERLRAARRVFNDPEQVEQIVSMLEATGKKA
jgi:ankyrin repeat protein